MRLSIIIPTLNESEMLAQQALNFARLNRQDIEVIVVDGGSLDDSRHQANAFADQVIDSPPGRALQMNAGANIARGDLLLFLHADSLLPAPAIAHLHTLATLPSAWGRFDIQFRSQRNVFRMVSSSMNWRSRLTKICTGDQGIFVSRSLFESVGGYPDQPLMEDIEICKRLRSSGQFLALNHKLTTSPRYWQRYGILRSILRMWRIRLLYFLGVPAKTLHRQYYV